MWLKVAIVSEGLIGVFVRRNKHFRNYRDLIVVEYPFLISSTKTCGNRLGAHTIYEMHSIIGLVSGRMGHRPDR